MNGGKDIKLGDDKRPVSFVPSNEQNLYNIRSGELLLDEYGNPLITEVDTYFLPDASMARSTSINFTDENTPYVEEDFKYIGTAAGVGAHYGNLDVHLDDPNVSTGNTVEVLQVSGAKIGVGTTAGTVPSTNNITPVTWFNRAIQTGINTVTGTFTPMDGTLPSIYPNVRVVNDLGGEHSNMLHFDVGVVSEHGAKVGDFVTGAHIPPGTQISLLAHNSQAHLTNDLQYTSPIKEYGAVRIRRAETKIKTSNSVWKIQEQFKETSEVSSTLLGVQRAETQLSLFSNVSTYGIDPDEFEQFSWTAGRSHGSWETRANKTYGKRYSTKMTEEVNEGGIKIGTFTTPYSFPFGPNWDRVGYYDQSKFGSYKNFINMGNDLYTIFSDTTVAPYSSYPSDFKDNFLPSTMTSVVGDDVEYHAGITTSFAQIDTWTDTWIEIRRGGDGFQDPVDGKKLDFGRLMEIVNDYNTKKGTNLTNTRTRDNTRPGYNTDYQKFIQLQSRRVFRYQPGRISGFTFGVRSSEESRDGSRIEWGIGNPTDQYVFSVNKGNFSIIRRSTIPFNSEVLARNGLKLTDQKKVGTAGAITSGDPYDNAEHWIIEIPSDNFNGDPLTGNGPSGYNLNIPNVTMYKIEFGWYGAIGARFYAYIPAGNGEARWVTLHTLVIENSLNQPCLQDSYFRLLYRINVTNTDSLKTPQYITKYGASYYIDGGDEGTVQMYSSTSGVKKITGISSESLLAIKPKDYIYNSLGVAIENKKLIIPTKLQVSSGALTQLKTVTCRACPGFGHVHTPGIGCTTNGRIIAAGDIIFTAGNTMQALNTAFFTEDDIGAKIIAPSINNAYIKDVSGTSGTAGQYLNATLEGYTGVNGPLGPRNVAGTSVPTLDQVTGITTNIVISSGVTTVTYPYDIRLSQFKGVVASDFALTGNKIEIQFINPLNYDSYLHWADFIIGLTDVKPNCTGTADANAEIVDWTRGTVTNSIVPKNDEIIGGRHTHQWESLDEKGVGQQESWAATNPPCYMGLDHRLPTVSSPAGGRCSLLIVEVEDPTYVDNVDYLEDRIVQSVTGGIGNGPVGTGGTQHYLRVKNANFPSLTYDGGQVAIKTVLSEIDPITGSNKIQIDVQTNIKYVGVTSTYYQTSGGIQDSYNYIEISEKLPIQYGTTGISVALRPVKASSPNDSSINNRRIYNYDPFPLYFIAKMQDEASINNISIKETIGDFTRTLNPLLYVLPNTNTEITNAGGNAVRGDAPTHFEEIERLSSAEIDIQNEQKIRDGYKVIDTVYVGANETQEIDLTPVFGPDRAVITPDNNNAEATFIIAKRIDNNAQSEIEASISFKEK